MRHTRLIADLCRRHDRKREQLARVVDITVTHTSDAGLDVVFEMYQGDVCRFVITGTRCGMVITYHALTNELCRKPRGARPWYTDASHINGYDIIRNI